MIIWGYEANRGEHQKQSGSGRVKHPIKSTKFSEEELGRVDSKFNELIDQNDECDLRDLIAYFDKEKKKYQTNPNQAHKSGRPNYSGGSPISKHKLYVIIDYMENHLKTLKRIEGVGSGESGRTKLVPIKLSEQLRKLSSYNFLVLVDLWEEVEKLKKKSKLTDEDILKLIMLENDVMKFPIRMERDLNVRQREKLFADAHRMTNNLLKETGEIKDRCPKSVLKSMSNLIKDSSLYCLSTSEIQNTNIGLRIKMQKRTIQAGLGS